MKIIFDCGSKLRHRRRVRAHGIYPTTMGLRIILLAMGLALIAGACADNKANPASRDTVTGTVIAVDASSLTKINSFSLRTGEDELTIYIEGDRDYSKTGFRPQHLREHVISAIQVRVEFERRGGRLIALGMTDA